MDVHITAFHAAVTAPPAAPFVSNADVPATPAPERAPMDSDTDAPDAQGWRASWGPPIPDGEVARHFVSCPICACRVASERFLNVHLNEAHALA